MDKPFTITLILILRVSNAARILAVFPSTSKTHQIVFRPLMLELSKNHEVTVITPDAFTKNKFIKNLTEIDIHDVSYNNHANFVPIFKVKAKTAFELSSYVFEKQVLSEEVQAMIKSNATFDLLFIEMCVRPALVFSYLFKAPVILISSFGGLLDHFNSVGAATHYFLYPSPLRRRTRNLSIWDKVMELYAEYHSYVYNKELEIWEDGMLKRVLGPNVPPVRELKHNVDLLFLNTYWLWDNNRPVPPNVVYLGGLHLKPKKKLTKDLQLLLDSSVGAIYMSFGTNVNSSTLPAEKIKVFTRIFSKLPYTILWKWNNEKLPGLSSNIIASEWFPQSDLLRGLQSTEEAIDAGVPVLGIPLIGDQWYHTEKYEQFKIGIKLDFKMITEEGLKRAIDMLMKDKSYKRNIMKLREIVTDQAQTPLQSAVWWTEYALRHAGTKHLKRAALSWTQYWDLELALTATFTILTLAVVTQFVIKRIRRLKAQCGGQSMRCGSS